MGGSYKKRFYFVIWNCVEMGDERLEKSGKMQEKPCWKGSAILFNNKRFVISLTDLGETEKFFENDRFFTNYLDSLHNSERVLCKVPTKVCYRFNLR